MAKPSALVLLFLTLALPGRAQETNYCHDPQAGAEWQALAAEYPHDLDLQTLHALRVGLCVKVEQGSLGVSRATTIFERARGVLLEQKMNAELKKTSGVKRYSRRICS